VEDHPLAYGSFEGTIPAGQYGAGTVMVWDQGTWEPIGDGRKGYVEGKLKFLLHGQHLKGGWTLVRMRGRSQEERRDNWLLIKERDRFALPGNGDALVQDVDESALSRKTMEQLERSGGQWISSRPARTNEAATLPKKRAARARAPIPGARRGALEDFVPPQLATPIARPPNGENWLHEIKLDGYRIYCRRDARGARLLTRTGQDWTERFRRLIGPLEALPADAFALDGEVVVPDEKGHSSFGALQEALSADDQRRLTLFAFDLLHLDGYDLRNAALVDRKQALRELIEGGSGVGSIRYSDHIDATGEEVFRRASELGLEGVVSKQKDRPYRSGRTADWVKSKCHARQEFVIVGFTLQKKGGPGIGALVVGYFVNDRLIYAGRVGTGFTHETSLDLRARLEPLRAARALVEQVPPEMRSGVYWVKPELVCDVEFLSWTRDNVLRQPSFQGLREDKNPRDVVRERTGAVEVQDPVRKSDDRKAPPAVGRDSIVAGIAITHATRVIFPDTGATKLDVARYYEAVADLMVPHLRERPLSLLRCPEGVAGTCFFQKHFGRTELPSLSRLSVQERKGKMDYLVLHRASDLVELAQYGIIELHPWGCRADDLERPDQLIFDLDPDPSVAWATVVDTALALRQHLADMDLVSFAKTTGGKGLHVVVPLQREASWDMVKEFARAFAESVVEAAPSMFTANPLKRLRKGKIFIDYLRNDKGSTAVAPYSVRAREGAPVSMPMPWEEITKKLAPGRFALRTVPALISNRADPWRDMAKVRQHITARARRAVGINE